MPQGYPKPGEFYLHFKKKLYQIVTIAEDSETQERLVIYQALYEPFQTYARPLAMFTSPVDKVKYPDAGQEYRFQLVEAGWTSAQTDDGGGQLGLASAQTVDGGGQLGLASAQMNDGGGQLGLASAQMDDGRGQYGGLEKEEKSTGNVSAEEKLMAFFDAETMDEKYKILLDMQNDITDRMINNMAVVLDVVIDEGALDQRYEELKNCVRTFRKYETSRLR